MARVIFMMFLVSEIHSFNDGNGRMVRIMMNVELVSAQQSKLLIPTVRNDYILNLKKTDMTGKPGRLYQNDGSSSCL